MMKPLLIGPSTRILAAGLAMIACQAHAGWTCSGRVQDLTLDPNGNVWFSLVNTDNTQAWSFKSLCNVRADNNGVGVEACKAIYGQLLASDALGRGVVFWFDQTNATTKDCSPNRFTSWTPLATTGSSAWYFGPKLAD